jgi:alpha-beta hydrolase superfamily lysophospholipase
MSPDATVVGTLGPIDLRFDVSSVIGSGEHLVTAAWAFGPEPGRLPPEPVVVFAFPGGGYTRGYFHMDITGYPDYSMAAHLAARGLVVIACDHLSCGESSRPAQPATVTLDSVVAANEVTARLALEHLRTGGLIPGYGPVRPASTIGIGHSLGAGLLTVQQERHGTFDGLVLLGRAVTSDLVPAPGLGSTDPVWRPVHMQHAEVQARSELVDGYLRQRQRTAWQRYLFYWEDVPPAVIEFDERQMTTIPLSVAQELIGANQPGARAASLVDVPVMLAYGERDVGARLEAEVAAYRAAPSVQSFVLSRSGHSTNLASGRAVLWDRIVNWIEDVVRAGARR